MKHRWEHHRGEAVRTPFAEGRSRPFCQAFTLIELVVILGIIAVLSVILLPALSAASEESRRTACKSNLHAFGSAFGLFAADNDGWLPQHVGGKNPWSFPKAPTDGWYGHTIQQDGELRNHGHLLAYLGETSVYWCPSQTGDLIPPGDNQRPLNHEDYPRQLALALSAQGAENYDVQSEYLYRKEWYELVPRYRIGTLLPEDEYNDQVEHPKKFAILADHFGKFDGVLAVTKGHETGYNFLRLDGAIDFFKHPLSPDGKLDTFFFHPLGTSSEPRWRAFDAYAGDTKKALAAMPNP